MTERECLVCRLHYLRNAPLILESCASVGIEHGASTEEMLKVYLDRYHTEHLEQERTQVPLQNSDERL